MVLDKLSRFFSRYAEKDDWVFEQLSKNKQYKMLELMHGAYILIVIGFIFLMMFLYYIYNPNYASPVHQVTVMKDGGVVVGRVVTTPYPRHTNQALSEWSVRAANTIFNYTFNNIEAKLNSKEVQQYFTKEGFLAFVKEMEESGFMETIKTKSQIKTVTVVGKPVMVGGDKGYEDAQGKKIWQISMPVVIRTSAGTTIERNAQLQFLVVLDENNQGRSGFFIREYAFSN